MGKPADIGHIQLDRDEMEVLLTLHLERYDLCSVMVTCNLELAEWDKIFKAPMTTACAIERLVHYAVILELPESMMGRGAGEAFRLPAKTQAVSRLPISTRNRGMPALDRGTSGRSHRFRLGLGSSRR